VGAPHDSSGWSIPKLGSHGPRTHQVRDPTPYRAAINQKIAAQSHEETMTPQSADQC